LQHLYISWYSLMELLLSHDCLWCATNIYCQQLFLLPLKKWLRKFERVNSWLIQLLSLSAVFCKLIRYILSHISLIEIYQCSPSLFSKRNFPIHIKLFLWIYWFLFIYEEVDIIIYTIHINWLILLLFLC